MVVNWFCWPSELVFLEPDLLALMIPFANVLKASAHKYLRYNTNYQNNNEKTSLKFQECFVFNYFFTVFFLSQLGPVVFFVQDQDQKLLLRAFAQRHYELSAEQGNAFSVPVFFFGFRLGWVAKTVEQKMVETHDKTNVIVDTKTKKLINKSWFCQVVFGRDFEVGDDFCQVLECEANKVPSVWNHGQFTQKIAMPGTSLGWLCLLRPGPSWACWLWWASEPTNLRPMTQQDSDEVCSRHWIHPFTMHCHSGRSHGSSHGGPPKMSPLRLGASL